MKTQPVRGNGRAIASSIGGSSGIPGGIAIGAAGTDQLPPIPEALRETDREIGILSEVVTELEARLRTVCAPGENAKETNPAPLPIGMLGVVQEQTRAVAALRCRLQSLRDGLQL